MKLAAALQRPFLFLVLLMCTFPAAAAADDWAAKSVAALESRDWASSVAMAERAMFTPTATSVELAEDMTGASSLYARVTVSRAKAAVQALAARCKKRKKMKKALDADDDAVLAAVRQRLESAAQALSLALHFCSVCPKTFALQRRLARLVPAFHKLQRACGSEEKRGGGTTSAPVRWCDWGGNAFVGGMFENTKAGILLANSNRYDTEALLWFQKDWSKPQQDSFECDGKNYAVSIYRSTMNFVGERKDTNEELKLLSAKNGNRKLFLEAVARRRVWAMRKFAACVKSGGKLGGGNQQLFDSLKYWAKLEYSNKGAKVPKGEPRLRPALCMGGPRGNSFDSPRAKAPSFGWTPGSKSLIQGFLLARVDQHDRALLFFDAAVRAGEAGVLDLTLHRLACAGAAAMLLRTSGAPARDVAERCQASLAAREEAPEGTEEALRRLLPAAAAAVAAAQGGANENGATLLDALLAEGGPLHDARLPALQQQADELEADDKANPISQAVHAPVDVSSSDTPANVAVDAEGKVADATESATAPTELDAQAAFDAAELGRATGHQTFRNVWADGYGAAHLPGGDGNAAWRDALATYAARHRAATAPFLAAAAGTSKAERGRVAAAPATRDARFLVVQLPDVGFGNQMTTLISGFAIGLMAQRTVLFHWQHDMTHTGVNGVLRENLALPPGLEWRYERVLAGADVGVVDKTAVHVHFMEEAAKQDPEFVSALGCGDLKGFFDTFQAMPQDEGSSGEASRHNPWAYLMTNININRALEVNPTYTERLRNIFRGDLFGSVAKWLVRPGPNIAPALESFMTAKKHGLRRRHPGHVLLGVHLRTGMKDNQLDVAQMATDRRHIYVEFVRKCMLDVAIATERDAAQARVDAMWAAGTYPFAKKKRVRVTIFLAADNQEVKKLAKDVFLKLPGIKEVVTNDDTNPVSRASSSGMAAALTDGFLLSQCDAIVRAGKQMSLFTNWAAGMMRSPHARVYFAYQEGSCDGNLPHSCTVLHAHQMHCIGVVKSVLTAHVDEMSVGRVKHHGKDPITCFGGAAGMADHLKEKGHTMPDCDWMLNNIITKTGPQMSREFTHPRALGSS